MMTRSIILDDRNAMQRWAILLSLEVLISGMLVSALHSQSTTPSSIHSQAVRQSATPAPVKTEYVAKPAVASTPTRYQPDPFAGKAGRYYRDVWGVDSLNVKAVESGELIRFTYRVLNPQKAKTFNDKKIEAFLNSPEHRIQLVIPSLEKVGQLRQSNTPEAGVSYWMAFSNPGRRVKRGDRVNIVIGQFHADGLVVE